MVQHFHMPDLASLPLRSAEGYGGSVRIGASQNSGGDAPAPMFASSDDDADKKGGEGGAKNTAQERPTIADVSRALGLTKSTVSRALNGYDDISERTKIRVRKMADKIGYVPLAHAQAIRTGRVRALGLIVQMSDHDAHRPFLAEFLLGISQAASDEGWTVSIAAATSDEETIATIQKMVRDRKVDGFILPRTQGDDARVHTLRDMNVPFVMFGRTRNLADCAWFDVLGENAMYDAVQRLHSLGHRRIGFINGGARYNYSDLRVKGFEAAAKALGIETGSDLCATDALTLDAGEEHALKMLRSDNPPTAIVCAIDKAALGAHRAVKKLGLVPGKDVSIIGYDGIPEGEFVSPKLSTYAVDFIASGKRLAAMLIEQARGRPARELQEHVEADFLDRGSVGKPAATSSELKQKISQFPISNIS